MDEVFYVRKHCRNVAPVCLFGFGAFGVGSVIVSLTGLPKDRAVYAALFFGTFWGSWACVAVWMILTYWRAWLRITPDQLHEQGVISTKKIDLDSVNYARWKITGRGRIALRTPIERLTIDFDNFEPCEVLWLIRFFRSRFSESVQAGWPLFAYKFAVRLRDGTAAENRPLGPNEVRLTRRRWDWYFVPAILVAAAFGAIANLFLQQPRMLLAPVGPVVIWLALRFMTPRRGLRDIRISSRPDLGFLGFIIGWLCLTVVGVFAFGALKLPEPAATWLAVASSIIWFAGLLFVVSRFDRQRQRLAFEQAKLAVQRWEEGERSVSGMALHGGGTETT